MHIIIDAFHTDVPEVLHFSCCFYISPHCHCRCALTTSLFAAVPFKVSQDSNQTGRRLGFSLNFVQCE